MNSRVAEASFRSDLRCHANRLTALRRLDLFCILQDNCLARLDQFGIAPDMPVPLFFRQVAMVKVLGKLPKLGPCV